MQDTDPETPDLEARFEGLCREFDAFHHWAIQSNISTRLEYDKHVGRLLERKEKARLCLERLSGCAAAQRHALVRAAAAALEAFRSTLAEARAYTAGAQPKPPFLY